LAIDVGECRMREIDVVNTPCRGVLSAIPFGALAKEDHLKTEAFTLRIRDVASVVPPLGAEIGMGEVVRGEAINETGQSLAIAKLCPSQAQSYKRAQKRRL